MPWLARQTYTDQHAPWREKDNLLNFFAPPTGTLYFYDASTLPKLGRENGFSDHCGVYLGGAIRYLELSIRSGGVSSPNTAKKLPAHLAQLNDHPHSKRITRTMRKGLRNISSR